MLTFVSYAMCPRCMTLASRPHLRLTVTMRRNEPIEDDALRLPAYCLVDCCIPYG